MNPYPAIFLGGFGMMATYWLTRSMRDSEPVVGVTPITEPVRTAALCAVAIVPFSAAAWPCSCSCTSTRSAHRCTGRSARRRRSPILVGQIVVPSLGGPLLGVALGRWVRFPGAAFVLFLLIFGWVNLVTVPSLSHPDSAPVRVLRLFSPFAFFASPRTASTSRPGADPRGSSSAGSSRCARSRCWWRCCAGRTAGCGPGSSAPSGSPWWSAVIMFVLADVGGVTHTVAA